MAKRVITNGYLSVNGVNLSSWVKTMTLNYSAEMKDSTTMTESTRSRLAGLKDWSIDVEFTQDYASGAVDATLFSLVGGSAVPIEVRADGGAVSATNPKYTGNGIVESYVPVGGTVGEVQMATCRIAGNGTLTRATA